MIRNIEGSKFLSNEQWLKLMSIVTGDKEMDLHMPAYDGDVTIVVYDDKRYIIQSNGLYRMESV